MEIPKEEAVKMNNGIPCRGWIRNLENVQGKVTLHATGDSTVGAGRIFVALPAGQPVTEEVLRKHNLM